MSGVKKFTIDDLGLWGDYQDEYLMDILNGDYDLQEAISDLRGLIGSKYDPRRAADIKE